MAATEGTIDRTTGVPAYRQIADHLRAAIAAGAYAPGDRLPSEAQLAQRFSTTTRTVRQALAVLGGEGLTNARHGVGVFVRRPPLVRRLPANRLDQARRSGGSLFETEVLEQGQVPTRRLVSVKHVPATPEVADRLGVSAGADVLARRRLMLVDGEPVKVTVSYFRLDLAAGTKLERPELVEEGMHVFMERTLGRRYGRYVEELLARMPTPEEAGMLGLGPGVPVVRILHADYDVEGFPLEVVESVFAGDKHVFVSEWPEPEEGP